MFDINSYYMYKLPPTLASNVGLKLYELAVCARVPLAYLSNYEYCSYCLVIQKVRLEHLLTTSTNL